MPKKWVGENSKAAVAKARKEATRQEELQRKKQAEEDALWEDDDKNAQRKQQRKEEREKKRLEQLEKKTQAKAMLEEEVASIDTRPTSAVKLSRAQIQAMQEEQRKKEEGHKKVVTHLDTPIEENLNLLSTGESARTVDEAITILSGKEEEAGDRHPERRMKAAFAAYEEKNLPRLKAENPNMRLSQLKQLLKKDWLKSPENPMNQMRMAYNAKP
ncbi:unnamed protein product [Darwinula stevensoni]|uniref:Coiled-coil domain-containing protein n=1 Tax=Darwinula stevensoni TaxID=69355 RepID=A0A7R8ZZS4_9CRUS|nr:unnamed protein product [Darwinula stevensoni]CAG0883104.1 unnamed protein product [Darwinula stevensoni]